MDLLHIFAGNCGHQGVVESDLPVQWPDLEEGAQVSESASSPVEVQALKKRIAQLEKDNEALRKQVLSLLEKSSHTA